MTGTVLVTLHHKGDATVIVKRNLYAIEDSWDFLRQLQDWYGCLPWQLDGGDMQFVAYFSENADEYFLAVFNPDN